MNDVTTQDGRVFYWLANIPYVRKDGSETEIAVWHSSCSVCRAPFTVATPMDFGTSKSFFAKHCKKHKAKPQ